MTFQPAIPLGGIAGWAFLNRTHASQSQSFSDSAVQKRDVAHFRDHIADISTARELVTDRQLLKVALGAFGLDGDIDKRFFVRTVLEQGTGDAGAMANRLVDKRYADLTDAFGFGSPGGPHTRRSGFAREITAAHQTRQFEIAVGQQNPSMRLAMSFGREIQSIAAGPQTGNTGWFRILGSPPLRQVVQTAFNLPDAFASLDIDRQVATLKDHAARLFGSAEISVFQGTNAREEIINRFLTRSDTSPGSAAYSPASAALELLQTSRSSSGGPNTIESLFAALY